MSDEVVREKRETVEPELSRIAYANMDDFITVKYGRACSNAAAIEAAVFVGLQRW
jgi:hypothetical protein